MSVKNKASDKQQQLVDKLKELFQMDQADLDFGIYRIMNAKHDEIEKFLNEDLLPAIRTTLESGGKASEVQSELNEMVKSLQAAGVDPETWPRVTELKALLSGGMDVEKDEEEIFSHLYTFFSRYYDGGDFMSLRRYKKETFSPLPMNGEEVKLHWANADQYYIKSSESFNNYSFKVPVGGESMHIDFVLTEAVTENNNNKDIGKSRVYFLRDIDPIILDRSDSNKLKFFFEYKVAKNKEKQKDINVSVVDALEKLNDKDLAGYKEALLALSPTEKNKKRTLLERHLNEFTAKYNFDYFIHKDLKGFLSRELNSYIKNELLLVDDLFSSVGFDIEKQVISNEKIIKKVSSFKNIASKLIAFLSQLEDFQRKLWLKKKFVFNSNWLISLDKLSNLELNDFIGNEDQLEEWGRIYGIDTKTLKDDFMSLGQKDFLNKVQYKFLPIDTAFYTYAQKIELISQINNIQEELTGELINGDNFQAIELIKERDRNNVDYIYIDPPYNTNSTPIVYKNGYKHSSWLSLINDRVCSAKPLLTDEGVKTVAIDDAEAVNLSLLLEQQYYDFKISRITVVHNPKGSITRNFNRVHEYAFFLTKEEAKSAIARTLEKNETPRKMRRWGENSLRTERRLSFYPVYIKDGKIVRWGDVPEDDFHPGEKNILTLGGEVEIWPIDQDGVERRWNFGLDSIGDNLGRIVALERDGEWDLFLSHELTVPKTVWSGGEFDAGKYGNTLLIDMLGEKRFDFPKSINLVKKCVYLSTKEKKEALVLDYFGGSGTTAHAVTELNREDNGSRKFIIVEMGEYFKTVTKPRIQKSCYSSDWKDGKPQVFDGLPTLIKYHAIESYDTALNNLKDPKKTEKQKALIKDNAMFREQYMLDYCLDFETKDSLFNIKMFNNPFDVEMKSYEDDALVLNKVDMIETFNYLLGLKVTTVSIKKGILEVVGVNNADEAILILWRDVSITSNNALDEWFSKQGYSSRDLEFDLIYVNGDNNLPNLRTGEESWKVQLIEEAFHTLMFDAKDV